MDPICGMETDEEDGPRECPHCGGEGQFMLCCDDLCHGQGHCIHGDNYYACPSCNGSGEL